MKSFLASVIALGLAVSTAFAQLTVNTPAQVVECEPLQITWTGGTGPFFLTILPGNQPTGEAIVNLGEFNGNSVTWLVNINIQSYSSIIINLRDSTGAISQSAPVNIQTQSVSCNTSSLSVSGTVVASGSVPTGNSPATATTTPSSQNTETGSTTSGTAEQTGTSSGGSSSAPSSTSTKSGASRVTGQITVAGIIGVAMVALLTSG